MSALIQNHLPETSSGTNKPPNRAVGTKTKRTLVIPDVHHKHKIAQGIIDSVPHDHVIHLGDHQDNFNDTVGHAVNTAKWTRDRLDAGDTVLLGNHDLPYWFPHPKHEWGCGWTEEKHNVIQRYVDAKTRKKFKLWTECGGWLLSHAGFCNMYADLIPHHDIFIAETLHAGETHPLIYHVGASRGGVGRTGGVLWLDWNDFKRENDLHGVGWKQIVGHTPLKVPNGKTRIDGNRDWCLDTHLHHYGIIEGGQLTIYAVER